MLKVTQLYRVISLLLIVLTGLGCSNSAKSASLQCQHLPQLFEAYLRSHYSVKKLNDEVKAHTVEQFIKLMDPSKTVLLKGDAERLKRSLLGLFSTMQQGNCEPLEALLKEVRTKIKDQENFARTLLTDAFQLDESVELIMDPDKRGYATTQDELNVTLKKMIHFQISNYLLTDLKLPEAKKQLIHRYELSSKRMQEKTLHNMIDLFAESFAQSLDPHSSFMSQEELEDFNIHMRLSLDGIGASLSSQDGFTVIEELIPGGGAEKSKALRNKDKIMAVAQEGEKPVNVVDMDLKDVVRMIRGKKGTKVILTILRQGEKTETFDVTIVRDKIDIKDQAAKLTYQTRKIKGPSGVKEIKVAIIDLPSFYGGGEKGQGRSSYDDMKQLVNEARKAQAAGMVINLSKNGGGLLDDGVKISGLFLRKGNIVAMKDADQRIKVMADEDDETQFNGPLVVLTSRISASASEIFAGAVKDYKRAIIVGGDHTFGKGTVQVLSGLPLELGAMKVTTGMFFLPGGKSTQHRGVDADIQLPSIYSNPEVGEATLDYSLAPQVIDNFVSKDSNSLDPKAHWNSVDPVLVSKLSEKSKARVEKSEKFAEIKKDILESEKNRGVIKLSEIRQKSKKQEEIDSKGEKSGANQKGLKGQKASKNSLKELKEKAKDFDEPYLNEGVDIVADWVELAS